MPEISEVEPNVDLIRDGDREIFLVETKAQSEIEIVSRRNRQPADKVRKMFGKPGAFLKRVIGPAAKISQKRRLQCFNNLVMLNNASLFFRLEHGRSPSSLSDLIEGKFINPNATDTCCSTSGLSPKRKTPNSPSAK